MPTLTLNLLGSPHIELDGTPVQVDTRKAIALLIYLAITNEAHTRDELATLLWPEYDSSSARAALRRTLSALRKALKHECLQVDWEKVGLKTGLDLRVDVNLFHSLLAETATHGHPASEVCLRCLAPLSKAVQLYRDDFISGFSLRDSNNFDDWQFFQTEALRQELAGALNKLARGLSQQGEFEAAISTARRRLALDPLLEEAHQQLMQYYAWAGQRNAALRQYRECVRILEQELGVPPLEETIGLYRSILENRAQLAPGKQTELRSPLPSMGDHAHIPLVAQPSPTFMNSQGIHPAGYPFVGRSHQLNTLLKTYRDQGPHGYFVAIQGEAGIGKTRLSEEFLEVARSQGALIISARCYQGETELAYSPFIDGINAILSEPGRLMQLKEIPKDWLHEAARLFPILNTLLPSEPSSPRAADVSESTQALALELPMAQSRFFEGLRQVLAKFCQGNSVSNPERSEGSTHHPERNEGSACILFLDDLHWADAASLDLLAYLVRRLRGAPWFTLVTWRGEELPAGHRLHSLVSEVLRNGNGAFISLDRLAPGEIEEMARAIIPENKPISQGFADRLYQETEGLPFFVVEYLGYLSQAGETDPSREWPTPNSVMELLRSRLSTLDEASRQLLTAAAVIGRSFDFNTLRETSGRSEMETVAGLESLLAQGLIKEHLAKDNPALVTYDFIHDKLRVLIMEETSLARQRLLHRRVAEVLTGQWRDPREPGSLAGQIASHYHLAGLDTKASDFYKIAGEHARALFANVEAVANFQAALEAGYPDGSGLYEAIADLQTLLGEYRAAYTSYEKAASLSSPDSISRLEHKLGSLHLRSGEFELAQGYFKAALETAGDELDPGKQARIVADLSHLAHLQNQTDKALDLANSALKLSELAGDDRAEAQVRNILGILARSQGEAHLAIHHLERALEIAQAAGDPSLKIAALNNLALAYIDAEDLEQAIQLAQEALDLCTRQGDRHREAALHNNLADLYYAAGQEGQSMDHLKKAVVIFAEIGVEVGSLKPEIWKLTEW